MRAERGPLTGTVAATAALRVEERSDEVPRAEVHHARPAPDPVKTLKYHPDRIQSREG